MNLDDNEIRNALEQWYDYCTMPSREYHQKYDVGVLTMKDEMIQHSLIIRRAGKALGRLGREAHKEQP